MKRFLMILLACALSAGARGCTPGDHPQLPGTGQPPAGNDGPDDPGDPDPDPVKIQITTGTATFTATLQNNATADAFRAMLPLTTDMHELNGNEKYHDLARALPMAASNPGTIRSGDIMLYGTGTLVLFYKTFPTGYSYTRIGTVDDPAGLESALGTGGVTISFDAAE